MFEIGKRYTVWMDEGDGVGSLDYRVDDFQAPLLRLHNPHIGNDLIVNTASPAFVRAQLSKFQDDIDSDEDMVGILKSFDSEPPSRE